MKLLIAKVLEKNKRQSILLPEELHIEGDEVYVRLEGKEIVLSKKEKTWRDFFEKTPLPSDDYLNERNDFIPQTRSDLL